MSFVGYSITPAPTTTEATVASQGESLESVMDELTHLRKKLAMVPDLTQEPDDVNTDNTIKNYVRES